MRCTLKRASADGGETVDSVKHGTPCVIRFNHGDINRPKCPQRKCCTNANCPATDHGATRLIKRAICCLFGQAHSVPTTGKRFGKGCFFQRHVLWHGHKVCVGYRQVGRKGTFAWRHRNDHTIRAQVVAPAFARITASTGHKRVDGHAPTGTFDDAYRLMPKDQRRGAPFVMAKIGVHI